MAVTAKSSVSVARKKVPMAVFRQVLHQLVDPLGRLLLQAAAGSFLSHGPDDRFRAYRSFRSAAPRGAVKVNAIVPRSDHGP